MKKIMGFIIAMALLFTSCAPTAITGNQHNSDKTLPTDLHVSTTSQEQSLSEPPASTDSESQNKPNPPSNSGVASDSQPEQQPNDSQPELPSQSNPTPPQEPELIITSPDELNEELYYGRNSLAGNEKQAYIYIVSKIKMLVKTINVHEFKLSPEQIKKIIKYIQYDYPQLYWCSTNISYISSEHVKSVSFEYPFTKAQILDNLKKMEDNLHKLMTGVNKSMSDYDKVKIIHDNLIRFAEYKESPNDQTILGILADGYGVCASYSRTFQYLCYKAGIQALYVVGKSTDSMGRTIDHGWNMVKMDKDYYYIDVTWDDPLLSIKDPKHVSYKFFGLTTQQIKKTHSFSADNYPLPECTATVCNYFIKEEMLFDQYSSQTVRLIIQNMEKIASNGGTSSQIMFSQEQAFNECLANLISNIQFQIAYKKISGNNKGVISSTTYPYFEIFW